MVGLALWLTDDQVPNAYELITISLLLGLVRNQMYRKKTMAENNRFGEFSGIYRMRHLQNKEQE